MAKVTVDTLAKMSKMAASEGRTIDIGDSEIKALRIRFGKSGTTTFSLMYRAKSDQKQKRFQIGRYPEIKLSEARQIATVLRGDIMNGRDPLEDRKRADSEAKAKAEAERKAAEAEANRVTVRTLANEYLETKENEGIAHYPKYKRMLEYNLLDPTLPELQLDFGDKAAEDLTHTDLNAVLRAVTARGSAGQARRLFEVLRPMCRYGLKQGYMHEDIIAKVNAPKVTGIRERSLSVEELRVVWLQLVEWQAAGVSGERIPLPLSSVRCLMLMLLLGQRSGEVSKMERHELSADGYFWNIPAERTKNGNASTVPLPPLAREIIAAACDVSSSKQYVFPARLRQTETPRPVDPGTISSQVLDLQPLFNFTEPESKGGAPLPWIPHDLRRTCSTYLLQLGVPVIIVDAILNHITNKKANVTTKHYDGDNKLPQMREALTRWQATIENIAAGEDPFATQTDDIAALEARILTNTRVQPLRSIEGGRS